MANNDFPTWLTGSICLSDIPRECMKRVTCKDGKERVYLNISVNARREPKTFTNGSQTRILTHYISCAPRKEERREGVNYIFGDLEARSSGTNAGGVTPSPEQIAAAPSVSLTPPANNLASPSADLPF